jgi:uncharacterized membrane protein YidH (DUF202 family)
MSELVQLLIVGAVIIVGSLFISHFIRRRQRDNGGATPKLIWLLIAIALVVVILLTIYSLMQGR